MTQHEANKILTIIRNTLIRKKIAFGRFFKDMDKNSDGFISVDEFINGIHSVITLALPMRQKLFAFFDR
jgi:hypothetical protein